jgi:putative ABC transport system substrate-binding protein
MTLLVPRRRFLAGATGFVGALSLPWRADAADPFKIFMITFRGETEVERGYRDYLAQRRIAVEITLRDAERDAKKVAAFVEEIRAMKPDLVYTWGTPVTLATVGAYDAVDPAKHITDIPVVFTMVAAPVRAKVVPSLASSGRNVTGAFHVVPTDAQLRAMQSYREFSKLGVIYTPSEQNSVALVEELRQLAVTNGFELIERRIKIDDAGKPVADGVEDLVRELKEAGATWFYLLPDTFLGTILDRVTPYARDISLPTFGASELAVREGGALAGLICRYYSVGQLTAVKSEQILVGKTKPADIPIETLRRFSLIVNMEVARALHLYPPLAMLNYAEVIRA